MHLQKFLHLPSTRQRNDGHHENQFETQVSPMIFPTHELKATSSRNSFFKTAATVLAFSASLIGGQVLSPHAAHAKPSTEKPVGTWGRTSAASSYIRIRPGVQTPVVAKVPRGMQIMVWGTFDGWYRVETTDHKFGWMRHDTVHVPRAQKLKELSHTKAKQASDRTGNQTLYGKPTQLKKYYATYKASGAAKGLKKQGVSLAQKPQPASAKAKLVKAPMRKPVVARSVAAPRQPAMPRVISITTAEPQKKAAVVVSPVEKPRVARPVVATITRPAARPVKATIKISRKAPQKTQQVEGTYTTPMPVGNAPITASDIMNARQAYLKNQLTSRRKTSPGPMKSSADSAIKTAPSGKPIAPLASRGNINAQPRPIYAQVKAAPAKIAKAAPSRGGSPRDYARVAAANNKFGSGMATQALTYRGMPYISGASSPRRGFDCSGLIYYLLRSRGYNPPRTAAGFASYGQRVAKGDLKPGDLVLFANTYKRGVSHIGVYTGNNNFVHAANSRSGVKTDSLSSGYYAKKYYGARRVK